MTPVPLLLLLVCARPLTLVEALDAAEANSAALDGARIQVERARLQALRAQIDRVRATVDGEVTELYNKPNLLGPDPPGSPDLVLGLSNLQASVTVPLFSGFAVTANVERAQAQQRGSELDVARQRQQLRQSVARAYWSIRRLDVLTEARATSLQHLMQSERFVKARVQAGLAPAVDENRAAQRRLELESAIADLRAAMHEETARFAGTLGLDEEVTLTEPVRPFEQVAAVPSLNNALVLAQGAHPDVLAARAAIDVAHAELTLARSELYPQIGAFAQGQLGNNPQLAGVGARSLVLSPNPFVGVTGDVQAGLVLRMNIFDTWRSWHAIDDAEHRERMALSQVRGVERALQADVKAGHARIEALLGRREAALRIRDLARDNEAIVRASYQSGDAQLLDLLDTSVALAGAEAQLADVEAQLTEAQQLFQIVIGGPA